MTNSNSLTEIKKQRFQILALLTVIIIYLLILAGGIVRSTGSGMGCPDWPRCFGRWIPPTEASQLPLNYQEIYGAKLKGEVEFNAVKTWIEYVNRLLGVLSGLFVFATLIVSFSYWRTHKAIVWGSIAAFLLIGANGWLGSRVVATELAHYMITLHLFLAILVVFTLLFVFVRARMPQEDSLTSVQEIKTRWLLLVVMGLTLGQVLLGTQVREGLDFVIKTLGYKQREDWISQLDWTFYVHRSFSLVILAAHLFVIYQLRKVNRVGWFVWIPFALISCILLEILTGIVMAYFGVPALAQPIHLVIAVGIVGIQFIAYLLIKTRVSITDIDRAFSNSQLVNR